MGIAELAMQLQRFAKSHNIAHILLRSAPTLAPHLLFRLFLHKWLYTKLTITYSKKHRHAETASLHVPFQAVGTIHF